jgi:hypothetical protein
MDEYLRKLIDMAAVAGEKRTSAQTGYLHLKYHAEHEDVQHTIPFVENFLFILALFRTKNIENITRAKGLLEKLLHFQGIDGNFPVYLHEYPVATDHYLSVQLLAPFYWIFQGFQQILGNELKNKVESSFIKLIKHSLQTASMKNPPFVIRFQIACGALAIGKLLGLKDVEMDGEKFLKEFNTITKEWFQPRSLSDLLAALQMITNTIESPFALFWDHIFLIWHTGLNAYSGPSVLEYQSGLEPEVTLYDLYMGYFSGKFSKRALKDSAVHLQAALIQPLDKQLDDSIKENWNGNIEDSSFSVVSKEKYSFAFIEQREVLNPAKDKGFSPFKLIWGGSDRLHTLTTEGGNSKNISFSESQGVLEFLFHLSEVPELEDKEKSREISFYFDLFDKSSVKIEGFSATTFKLGEKIDVNVDGFKFSLKFELVQGEGQFLGHFMRGNRPSQIANKGKERFAAYDWQLFLRTIRRPQTECVIKATIELQQD